MVTTETLTDGNASFLRAARSGNVDKIIEHLKGNIDINTSNANGLNALHLAAKEGHVHIVTELLKRGANVNAATKKGNTALHIASLAGQAEVARMLVQLGAGVNAQSQNGFTPLYMAAQENHDDVVSFLLAHGANQSLATEDGFTPLAVALQQGHDKVVAVLLENDTKGRVRLPALHIAAKKDDCKAATLLLQSDHNPDVTSKSGFTPLHIAAHYGNENIAKILLGKGADVNYAAKHQITPLHVASKWGKMNMVLLLLEQGANIEASTRDGLTPLHCAARSGHDQVVDVLLEKGAPFLAKTKNGLAPLHMASQGDHIDSARILLYHKAPVDDVTVDYLTALHVAAHCGHVKVAKLLLDRKADANARALNGFTPLHIACKKNRIKVVELLLKHGASIEATTESGLTPLHVASFMGCMNIVIFLIQSGAHPDVPTVRGETPLHLAARANQTDIIRILLRNGASVDARAREDQTPLHIASRLGNVDIVSLLLQHGAAVDATTKDLYTALHIAAKEDQEEVASSLLDHGAALAATTKKGFTPLHLAAKYGNIKVARLLIQKNAAVDAQGKNGVTPLHVAAHYDHVNVALLLLDKGASPHATAKNGYTPLHIAAKKNQMDIASTLLEYGAKTNAESKAGFTPLHLSSQEGHVDMSSLLIENKADVNHKANNGLTPLHLCAQDDRVDVAHILVGHKAEIGPQTKAGYTPLHVASHFGQMNMVRFLLQHGADVHTTTAHGYTSLHQAAQQGHTLAVNLLLENQASPNVTTSQGQTPLSIAQRLGYISVVETLKVVTETIVTTTTTTVTEEKYKVVAPETMQETFMTDSEDEGGADFDEAAIFGKPTHATHVYLPYVQGQDFFMSEEAMLGDQSYGYLTADEMKSLGDDSLPIDVTKDEKHQDLLHNIKQFGAPMVEEDKLSPQHATPVEGGFSEKFSPDNIDLERAPMHAGSFSWADDFYYSSLPKGMCRSRFLVSFMVDARGGAMRGCRHSGVRVIIPPRKASMPMRITCRFLRREKLIHPPPLMEGEACASRILEMGPVGAKFLGPVIIEVPHFASTRGKEREITILRSDTGETWKEHTLEASEEAVQEVLNESFEGEELSALEDLNTNRITRILTTDFPQYFAIVTRVRQEVHGVGPEGGMVSSTVVPQVQAVFPEGALTKKIRVGLQAQPIAPELVAKLLGNRVAVSPIVTVEPRRRKFHKPITLTIPVPQATTKGMINQYSGDAPTLRLLCSITGGSSKAQWEDVTGSTPLTFVNDCVSFTTTVSARFWLMDCRQVNEVTRFATELYQEAVYVPFMSKFVVFAKRQDAYEAQLRVFCMTDDREDKTLECQEHFTEIAKSRDVEVLEGKLQYLEFAGNIAPVTKSGEQLRLAFQAFHENRLPFTVRVRDPHAEPLGRVAFMREPKMGRGEPPQVPICNLNVALPDTTLTEATSSDVIELVKLEKRYDFVQEAGLSKPELIHRADLRLSDIAQGLDKDWVLLAKQLEVSDSDVQQIQADTTCDQPEQALIMLRLWLQKSGSKATGNELEKGLRKINREDIIKNCMFNVELVTDDVEKAVAKVHLDQSGFDVFKEELGSSREASMRRGASLDVSYDEQDIMKDAESAAETSSETGSLFDKDQISHALTEDRVNEQGKSSKNDADDENDAAVLFPKCKKSSSKHTDAQGAENGDSPTGSPVDSRYHTEETNITQKHFVKTHDFWPPDKLVEINVTDIQTIQTDSSSDTSVKTQILNNYNNEIEHVSSPTEQLPSDFTNVCEPTIPDTKSELTMDLLQKRDGELPIDPSDFGYFSMDKDSNMSPNTTSDSIKFVNVSQLPDVVAHECASPTQNITTPFPVHSVHVDELGSAAMMQSSEIEQGPIPGAEAIPESCSPSEQITESTETSPMQNITAPFSTQTVPSSVQNTATFHDTSDHHLGDLKNQELLNEDSPSPVQSIPTPFPTHSMHIKELSPAGPLYSSVSEQTPIQDTATACDTLAMSDSISSEISVMPEDQNLHESNSESRGVCSAEIENVIHQTVSGIITGNNVGEGNASFEDARIRRASKTPPPSPVDKPDKGGESLGKGVEILLSQSSLEEKLKEPVDLANRSYDILGRDELQVRLTESETWPSLELDTSQVSISSLPDDEKSEPTTATASDAVADAAAADKGITFVERIEKSEYEGPGVTSVIKTTTQMTTYSSGAPCTAEEAKEQTEKDSLAVREVGFSKETKPSGLGGSLEEEVVSAFEPSVVKQVVQENLEEYIATLSGERSQLPTLDSDQDFERLEKELEESVVVEPQVHAQKLHEENLQTEEVESVVKTVPCAFDNTAFAGAEVIDEVDQKEPIRARSPYEVIRDYEVPEPSHTVTEQTESEDLGTSKKTYVSKHVEEDSKETTRTTYVLKQVEAIRHRPILQHIPSEISEEDLVEREIVSPISRRDSDVLDSPTEGSPRRVSGTHSYQEDDSNVFLSELPAGSGGLWDTSRVTQITTTRTTSRTVSERLEDKDSKDSKTNETGSDSGIFKESVTVTTTCQSIAAPHEKESQPCLPTQQISSSEDARVLNGPGEVDYQPEYDLGGEIVQTRRSGGVYHTDRPLQISTSSSDEFKRRHYSSVSDDVLDSEIGDILRSGQQFDEDIIDRPMTPEPPIDEIEYGISISAKTLSDLTKLELDDDTIQRRVFPDFDDDRIASPPLSPDDSRAGFAYGMQFEKDVLDTVEEAMDMDSDPYSEEKEAVFDYGMRFEREPGLEDDDIRHYGDLYTHQEEDEDALENGDKVKIVAKSKRDSDFDILAGRKFFTKNVEMDELSMSSLQEFERLESELVSGRKSSVGSIDSLNGKPASKSGDHDDVSMSSLTEFERLEKECIEKEGINPAMQESTLSEIEEGHESQASETSQENKSDGCKDESSIAEGFDRHLEDIEKIILKTDSGDKEELSFQHLITQTTKSSGKTTDSTTTSMVSRMHVLQRSQDSFSKSDGRNDDIDQDSLHDELSLKPDSLADDTKHEYLDSLHEGRCDDADSLQGDMPDEMRDSLFEDRHLEDDSLRDMDILPDESSLSMESSLAAPLSHDEVVKEITHSTQTISKEERILEGTSGVKRAEIVVSELPKGDVMLSSTDSLEQSSSAAAAFHFESESAMSTSLTGHLQSEDNTMISSTDTLEHEGRITFRYEDIPIDDLEILIKDGRQVIVDSEGNVQTEYDVKHFLDNSADNINNEFKFCSKGFIQDTHPSGSMQVEKVMTSLCYSGGPQGTGAGPQTTGTFDTSYSDPEVEIEEIHTTDEFGNPKVIKKIKKVVQSRTQYTSSSSSANVEEKLKDFLREHAAGEGAGIGEELVQEERTIDDKGNVVVVRTVQQQVVSHPEVHSRTFTGPDAGVLSEEYVERFKELDPTDDVCEYEKIDDQGNVVRVTQQVVIKPEVHSISFCGPDAHQQMEEYMKRFTPMSQNGSRTRAGETTYTGAQVSTATEQEYIPSESDSHDMGSTTYIKTTISNIVPESSEQFVVRTTTSTTVTSTDGTVKTNGSPEQKSSPKAD